MPKDKDPLPAAQIALIRRWIDQGAVWPETADAAVAPPPADAEDQPEHWAYRRAGRARRCPTVRNADWARTPIDRFVLARLEKEGLTPSPEAPLDTLVRRVSLDLIGLPPSPQEVDEVARRRGAATATTPHTRGSSIACWRRRTTASGGRGPGSISRATPTRTASRRICRA